MNENLANDPREPLYQYVKDHFWSVRNFSAQTLSSTCRQLALAEGGLCWLIKSSASYSLISCQTNGVLIALVLFFIFDAMQYLISSIKYHDLAERYDHEILNKNITKIEELKEPKKINRTANIFFTIKLFILSAASLTLIYLILKI